MTYLAHRKAQKQKPFVAYRSRLNCGLGVVHEIAPEPDWLKKIGEASKRRGTDRLTMRAIDVEIAAARRQMRMRAR
jgi:hypothetical protein